MCIRSSGWEMSWTIHLLCTLTEQKHYDIPLGYWQSVSFVHLIIYWLSLLSIEYIGIHKPGVLKFNQLKVSSLPLQWRHPAEYWTVMARGQPAGRRQWSFPSIQYLWESTWSPVSSPDTPSTSWTMECCSQCRQGPQEGEDPGTPCTRRGWENLNLLIKRCREGRASLSWDTTVVGHEVAASSCRMGILVKYKDKIFTVRVIKLWEWLSIEVMETLETSKAWLALALFRP